MDMLIVVAPILALFMLWELLMAIRLLVSTPSIGGQIKLLAKMILLLAGMVLATILIGLLVYFRR